MASKRKEDISDYTMDRGLPCSVEAERAILGAVILDNSCFWQAGEKLKDEDFMLDSHRRIYRAMVSLMGSSRAVDFVTITEVLGQGKELDSVGGVAYVTSLTDGLPRVKNISQYVNIVRDKSNLRYVIRAAGSAVSDAYDGEASAGVIGKLQEHMIHIGMRDRNGIANIPDLTRGIVMRAVEAKEGKRDPSGYTTTVPDLNELTGGIRGEYIILAGRTGHGKSSFARQIALANAKKFYLEKSNKKVGFFTFEMSAENLTSCMIASESGVDFNDILDGRYLKNEELERIGDAATKINQLSEKNLFIDDSSGVDITELCSRIRSQIMQGAALIIVDYLQMVHCGEHRDTYDKVTAISAALRDLSKATGVPIIALAQLKRPEQGRENIEPSLFDLKESGNIENDAFQVWLIYRPRRRDDETQRWVWTGEDWILVAKNRNGPVGHAPVVYIGPLLKFQARLISTPEPPKEKAQPKQLNMHPAQRRFRATHQNQD